VLLPRANASAAIAAAGRIRSYVGSSTGTGPAVQVSIGLTVRSDNESDSTPVVRADEALQGAKETKETMLCSGTSIGTS